MYENKSQRPLLHSEPDRRKVNPLAVILALAGILAIGGIAYKIYHKIEDAKDKKNPKESVLVSKVQEVAAPNVWAVIASGPGYSPEATTMSVIEAETAYKVVYSKFRGLGMDDKTARSHINAMIYRHGVNIWAKNSPFWAIANGPNKDVLPTRADNIEAYVSGEENSQNVKNALLDESKNAGGDGQTITFIIDKSIKSEDYESHANLNTASGELFTSDFSVLGFNPNNDQYRDPSYANKFLYLSTNSRILRNLGGSVDRSINFGGSFQENPGRLVGIQFDSMLDFLHRAYTSQNDTTIKQLAKGISTYKTAFDDSGRKIDFDISPLAEGGFINIPVGNKH